MSHLSRTSGDKSPHYFFENTKLQMTLLAIGAALIAGGIALNCLNHAGASMGGTVMYTIGAPLALFGILGLINNKCINQKQTGHRLKSSYFNWEKGDPNKEKDKMRNARLRTFAPDPQKN